MTDLRKAAEMALHALKFSQNMKRCFARAEQDYHEKIAPIAIAALCQALAQPDPVVNEKDGSPCPEFWDWLPKAYNFEGNGTFTKYNMEVAFLAGKNTAIAQPEQVSIEPPDYVEPVTYDYHEGWEKGFKDGVESVKNKKESTPSNVDPLLHGGDGNYIKQAQPEQEPAPVGMTCKVWTHGCALFDGIDLPNETLLYTAPPSKPWVGLENIDFQYQPPAEVITMKYAEAILKEKNT